MNLNTFARHGVFGQPGMTELIANRLRDGAAIARARVFPYQLMVAYTMAVANADIPQEVCDALQDAMEIATANVPEFKGKVYVFPDVSGSMHSAVTGYRQWCDYGRALYRCRGAGRGHGAAPEPSG